jgi:hypothetical protein
MKSTNSFNWLKTTKKVKSLLIHTETEYLKKIDDQNSPNARGSWNFRVVSREATPLVRMINKVKETIEFRSSFCKSLQSQLYSNREVIKCLILDRKVQGFEFGMKN